MRGFALHQVCHDFGRFGMRYGILQILHGDPIRATFCGLFFKLWSYSFQHGAYVDFFHTILLSGLA